MSVNELQPYLQDHWQRIKEQLLQGKYQPQPVLRVQIPKPGGEGMRKLGIPTVVDRLIQHLYILAHRRRCRHPFNLGKWSFEFHTEGIA